MAGIRISKNSFQLSSLRSAMIVAIYKRPTVDAARAAAAGRAHDTKNVALTWPARSFPFSGAALPKPFDEGTHSAFRGLPLGASPSPVGPLRGRGPTGRAWVGRPRTVGGGLQRRVGRLGFGHQRHPSW